MSTPIGLTPVALTVRVPPSGNICAKGQAFEDDAPGSVVPANWVKVNLYNPNDPVPTDPPAGAISATIDAFGNWTVTVIPNVPCSSAAPFPEKKLAAWA